MSGGWATKEARIAWYNRNKDKINAKHREWYRRKRGPNARTRVTHGHSRLTVGISPTYSSWTMMRQRCNNPKTRGYERYGGRGITVCDRWANSFENFLEDMGERPKGKTLDRIDSNKNYCKENCQWSTPKEQASHRRMATYMSNNTSGYIGVFWVKRMNKWQARRGKMHLGTFDDFESAVRARQEADRGQCA